MSEEIELVAVEFELQDVLPDRILDELTNEQLYSLLDELAERFALEMFRVFARGDVSYIRVLASESDMETFQEKVRYGDLDAK